MLHVSVLYFTSGISIMVSYLFSPIFKSHKNDKKGKPYYMIKMKIHNDMHTEESKKELIKNLQGNLNH